jgi:Mg2+/citrate symporter
MNWALVIVGVAIAAVIAWNFVPSIRERMRGWSTVAEGAIGVLLTMAGVFVDALQEAQRLGYLPPWALKYLPAIFFAWMIWKRFITTTPPGRK